MCTVHGRHTATVASSDDVNGIRSRNICNYCTSLLPQTNISSDGKGHFFGEWIAKVADDSQALAIGVMGEADGSAAGLHYRTELGHSLGLRLGSVRERGTGIIVNCKNFAS